MNRRSFLRVCAAAFASAVTLPKVLATGGPIRPKRTTIASGCVRVVTNLNDSGPGSMRDACSWSADDWMTAGLRPVSREELEAAFGAIRRIPSKPKNELIVSRHVYDARMRK